MSDPIFVVAIVMQALWVLVFTIVATVDIRHMRRYMRELDALNSKEADHE